MEKFEALAQEVISKAEAMDLPLEQIVDGLQLVRQRLHQRVVKARRELDEAGILYNEVGDVLANEMQAKIEALRAELFKEQEQAAYVELRTKQQIESREHDHAAAVARAEEAEAELERVRRGECKPGHLHMFGIDDAGIYHPPCREAFERYLSPKLETE